MQHWIDRSGIAHRPMPKLGETPQEREERRREAPAWGLETGAVHALVQAYREACDRGDSELTALNAEADAAHESPNCFHWTFARRNGMGFHLIAIPAQVDNANTMMFDTGEMRRLYAFGEEHARSGRAWLYTPLRLAPDGDAPALQARRTSITR